MASGSSNRKRGAARNRTAEVRTAEMIAAFAVGSGSDSWVIVYTPSAAAVGQRTVLDPEKSVYVVGRSSQCDIVADSSAASRQHARVERRGNAWWLVDLKSLNGTYVNDHRASEHALANGDRVHIGDVIFKHLSGDDVEAAYLEALRTALVVDGLTQASNDRAFRQALDVEVERAAQSGAPLSLALADVDYFKRVNDEHGHPSGDRVLREFVRVVRAAVPDFVAIGRGGGEEFGFLMPGVRLATAAQIAERARAAVETHEFHTGNVPLRVTASFGVAQAGGRDDTSAVLFAAADRRLYASKSGGRNRVTST